MCNRASFIPLLIVGLGLAAAPLSASALDPKQHTEALIDQFKSVRKAPVGKTLSASDNSNNCAVFSTIDTYFDVDQMVEQAVGDNRTKLTPQQLAQLKRDLRELVRLRAYPNSGSFFNKAEYAILKPKIAGNVAEVYMDTYVEEDDWETEITFHWQKQSTWRIVDASFDGDSLVVDYRNQFARIIAEEGVQGFLQKITDKITEAKRKYTDVCAK